MNQALELGVIRNKDKFLPFASNSKYASVYPMAKTVIGDF